MTAIAEAAVRYAERGFWIFPLRRRGKVPLIATGFHAATRSVDQVRAWWAQWQDANIGCCPGRSGYVVLDVDGPEGEISGQRLGLLAEPTLEVQTGREGGGRHRWYKHPGGQIGNRELAARLDVRADAGYVVLPPSVHPSGKIYRWHGRLADCTALPEAIAAQLRQPTPASPPADLLPELIPEGERDTTLTSIAGALRRRGCSAKVIRVALAGVNRECCRPPLANRDLDRIALSVGRYPPAVAQPPRMAGSWDGLHAKAAQAAAVRKAYAP